MWLVVGLGNPGDEYAGTRHNIGFRVVDELLRRTGAGTPRAKFGALVIEGQLAGERVIFCKPQEFMNVSGQSVARVAQFWKVPLPSTLVIHDDLDLPFGRLKLGAGGGAGGHNGLRSIIADAGGPEFIRVRVGIDRPPPTWRGVDYVLAAFSAAERAELPVVIGQAADAAETIVAKGLTTAMNRFNQKQNKPEKP